MPSIVPSARAIAPEIRSAISGAAQRSGVSFDFLVRQAEAESGFDPKAKAATSSAAGLYQFIEHTWLDMVRRHGAKYGLAEEAAAIGVAPGGNPRIAEPATRAHILELRNDPRIAAAMAAEFTRGNQDQLRGALGREPSATDLYLAHFLGAHGATRFLDARSRDGAADAAALLPEAAAANRAVFFAADGRARSLDEIHARFAKRFAGLPPVQAAAPEIVAAVARTETGVALRSRDVLASYQTRIAVLQGLSAKGLAPLTVAALAALDDRDGRTVAGRAARRGLA